MRFRRDNKIKYGQDHRFFRGIPAGVEFRVARFLADKYCLVGCGYGCQDHANCYGSGSLIVYGLTAKQRKRFKQHLSAEAVEE